MDDLLSNVDELDDIDTDDGVAKEVNAITPSAVVVCGNCGAKMKNMGPLNRNTMTLTHEGESRKFSVGTWVYSCRLCRSGSVRAHLNPMLDTNDVDAILPAREQLVGDMMHDRVKFSTQIGEGHVIVRGDELVEVEIDGTTEQFDETRKDLDAIDE